MNDAVVRVIHCLNEVFKNKGQVPPKLGPETVLDRSIGLQSIDFAEMVIRLEEDFGVDPFSEGANVDVMNIQQLASLYSNSLKR